LPHTHVNMPDEIPVPNEQCCSLPPFTSDYSPVGEFVKLGVEGKEELEVYITGPKNARAALICIYGLPRPLLPTQYPMTSHRYFRLP
jgi:hypothetical protein